MKLSHFFKKNTPQQTNSSDFSVFFREASSSKKKEVFMDIAHKASADQRQVIETAHKITATPA